MVVYIKTLVKKFAHIYKYSQEVKNPSKIVTHIESKTLNINTLNNNT